MKKFYMRVGLKQKDSSRTSWVIYSPNGGIFCTLVGEQRAKKLRNYLNKEFIDTLTPS